MNQPDQVETLKVALLDRGQRLADEYLAEGRRHRESTLKEAEERIRRHEEREKLRAETLADRVFRRQVQAGELRMQTELDQLRWSLVQAVMDKVRDRLKRLSEDEASYLPVLEQLIKQAAAAIERESLTAQVNGRDLKRLKTRWESRTHQLIPNKRIELIESPLNCPGGVLVQSEDERIRVDNTFEGRMERLHEALQQVIEEQLFEAAESNTKLSHG